MQVRCHSWYPGTRLSRRWLGLEHTRLRLAQLIAGYALRSSAAHSRPTLRLRAGQVPSSSSGILGKIQKHEASMTTGQIKRTSVVERLPIYGLMPFTFVNGQLLPFGNERFPRSHIWRYASVTHRPCSGCMRARNPLKSRIIASRDECWFQNCKVDVYWNINC